MQVLLSIASAKNELPIFAKAHLDKLDGKTCFLNDLHVGTRNANTALDFGLSRSVRKGPRRGANEGRRLPPGPKGDVGNMVNRSVSTVRHGDQ